MLIGNLRAAWWAAMSIRRARNRETRILGATELPRVPNVGLKGHDGVRLSLRLFRSNCLVRAAVLQAWYSAHGDKRDIVIGVTAPSKGFAAHAWLDGDPPCHSVDFKELLRRPASR
jgi:hypothetical protein